MYTRLKGRFARFHVHKEVGWREGKEVEIGVAFMHRAFLDVLIISRIILHYRTLNISEIKEMGS